MLKIYEVRARSFPGRIPLWHEFEIAGTDEEDVKSAIEIRWPSLYEVVVSEKVA